MNSQGHYFVLRISSGLTLSKWCRSCSSHSNAVLRRVKNQLRSGELAIAGDQWPIFLYVDCDYDPERNGLLRSALLVSVSI